MGGFSLSSLAPTYYLTGFTYFGLAPYLTIVSAETHFLFPPFIVYPGESELLCYYYLIAAHCVPVSWYRPRGITYPCAATMLVSPILHNGTENVHHESGQVCHSPDSTAAPSCPVCHKTKSSANNTNCGKN